MKSDKLVVNASPLISLAEIGFAGLLLELSSELIIPEGVFQEIVSHGREDAAVEWIQAQSSSVFPSVEVPTAIASWNLGRGESEVIAFAHHNRAFSAVIDDRSAKRCAGLLGITVHGTISMIIHAKRNGLVDAVKPLLEDLQSVGFRIGGEIVREALVLAGEE